MAASPEGIIRHWPSVASEGAYVEVSTELDGQECFSLTQFEVCRNVWKGDFYKQVF